MSTAQVPIRPGLCSITFRHLSARAVAGLAASAGLEGIEWGSDVHLRPGETGAAHDLARTCDSLGLECVSYGSYLRAGDPDGVDPGEVGRVLDTAVALGAPNVRIWCGVTSPDGADDLARHRAVRDLRAIAEAAAGRDLTVSVEHHAHTLTETAASTLELLGRVGAPNLFTYWQPIEGHTPGEAHEDLAALVEALSHLHVFRWRSFEDRMALAEGGDIWPGALRSASVPGRWGRSRWALLEYVRSDDPGQLAADADTLRGWLGSL